MERCILGDVLTEAGYLVRYAWDLESAQRELEAESVHVVLLDMNLPDGNGAELITMLAATRPEIAIVVVSSDDRVGTRVRALRLGAADYLVKPYNPDELVARVDSVVAARRCCAGEAATANRDNLCGALCRDTWLARFADVVEFCDSGVLALADLVGFRAFNSSFGWLAGDEALTLATEALLCVLPLDVALGRTDGDEFAAVFCASDSTVAQRQLLCAERRFARAVAERFGSKARLSLATAIATWAEPCSPQELWAKAQTQLAVRLRRDILLHQHRLSVNQETTTAVPAAAAKGVEYAFA